MGKGTTTREKGEKELLQHGKRNYENTDVEEHENRNAEEEL
jgi:hypothetical protein